MPRKKKTENVQANLKEEVNKIAEEKAQVELIPLAELINMCINFMRGKNTVEDMNQFGDKIIIKNYIPILKKNSIVMSLIFRLQHDDSAVPEVNALALQKYLFFYVLLGEYANIDVSDESFINYNVYDILYPILANYILPYCERDYNIIVKMIEDSLNLYNIRDLNDMLESVDYEKIVESNREVKKLVNYLNNNKDTITDLKDIVLANHPATKDVESALSKAVLLSDK